MWSTEAHVRPTYEEQILGSTFSKLNYSKTTHLACAVLKSSRTSASTEGGGCLMDDPGDPVAPGAGAPDADVPVVVVEVGVGPAAPEPAS